MIPDTPALSAAGLLRYQELGPEVINTVTERFYSSHGALYRQFGTRGREACREDLGYHLEFLRPVLEFGFVQPMVDYLRWLATVLATRDVPSEHLTLSLDWLAEAFAARMEGPDADLVVKALAQVKARFREADGASTAIFRMLPDAWPESASFEGALLAGDRRAAQALLERCLKQGHDLVQVEQHLIQPALYRIGRQWQNNQVSVAQEHLATAIAQSVMASGLLQSALPVPNGSKVLLACVQGNQHCVGLQMVADAFQLAGWEVQYLGANVPTKALIEHVARCGPDLLGLSVSIAPQLHIVKDVISRLGQALGSSRPPTLLGGLAINQFSSLAEQLGADAWSADASSAVAAAPRIAMRSPGE
jgi:methanogenic corrinoid protein MtbC1